MTPELTRTLFAYDAWANRRSLEACATLTPEQFTRDLGSSFPSVRDTLAHLVGAQFVWLERFHGRVPSASGSSHRTTFSCRARSPRMRTWRSIWSNRRNLPVPTMFP